MKLAVTVLNGASGTSPPTNIGVRFGNRDEVCGGMIVTGRRGAVPYRKTDILVIKVWFAVVVDNGQSRTPVPTNKVFVSPIEVRFAVGVCIPLPSPSPSVPPLP